MCHIHCSTDQFQCEKQQNLFMSVRLVKESLHEHIIQYPPSLCEGVCSNRKVGHQSEHRHHRPGLLQLRPGSVEDKGALVSGTSQDQRHNFGFFINVKIPSVKKVL